MQILPSVQHAPQENAQGLVQSFMGQSLQQFSTSFASSLNMAQNELISQDSSQTEFVAEASSTEYVSSNASQSEPVSQDTEHVREEVADSEEEKVDEAKEALEQAEVYNRHRYDGHTYTLEEMSFSQKECAELYNALLADGVQPHSLSGLRKLTELPDGCTLGQVMLSLKGEKSDISLSDADANDITSLLDGLDPSGQLSAKTLDALYQNKPLDALRGIHSALEDLGTLDTLEVSKQEMLALGRGLGLNEKALQKLQDMFGDQENATLTPQGMKKMLAPAEDQLLQEKSELQKLDSALAKNLGPMLNKANERMSQEAAAQNLRNRDADHSQTMIDRTVLKDSRTMLNHTLDGMQKQSGHEVARQSIDGIRVHAANFAEVGQQGAGQDMTGQQEGWNDLFGKMAMQVSVGDASQAGRQSRTSAMATPQQVLSQQLVSQVENGLFSTLRNGASRLELQLHPQELGALTISLVAHNGEISAHIKADNAETAALLGQQADLIRSHLEEQGVKVDSIEVELREQNSSQQQLLQDMESHNSFQQEDARREQLRRLRNLASLENRNGTDTSGQLERSVHSHRETETSASRLLDRVA